MKRPIVITLLVIALLLALAGIGAVVFFAVRSGGNFAFDQSLASAIAEETKSLKVDGAVTLIVNDEAGDVTIVGGDVEKVEVKIVKTGNAPTQTRAEQDLKNIKYEVQQSGNKITLTYKLPNVTTNHPDTIDFIVTVPTETTVKVVMSFGDVNVSNTKGAVDIDNDFGEVNVQNIEGALTVSNSSGNVEAISIKAGNTDIVLNSDFGNITLEKANAANITFDSNSGRVSLKDVNATGDFYSKSDFGDTKYENGSAASVNIESNSGKVELIKLKVDKFIKVDDDFGDIELIQVTSASYDLHTNSGTITVDGAKSKLNAHTDFGNIEITNAQLVTLDLKTNSGQVQFSGSLGEGPHNVQSDFGGIDIVLPADAKLNVDLQTDFGSINSDLPITVTFNGNTSSDKDKIVGSLNGGGDLLTVNTNSGNINISVNK